MNRIALSLVAAALACASPPRIEPSSNGAHRVIELRGGHWFDGTRFVDRTLYSVDGVFSSATPTRVDSVIELGGGFVVPPFGEAHNHNVDAASPTAARAVVDRYMRDGVFYAQNPCGVARARRGMSGFVNTPTGLDATFSNACLTAPGGHPMGLYLRNLGRGVMLPTDSNSTEGFVWTIADRADLDAKWPRILASNPDFIKAMLLYSEAYERRRNDTAYFNWRGLDPVLLQEIVRRAHASGRRVMTHIETAADFHNSLAAGVDEIGHTPGFRGNEKTQLPTFTPYLITDSDAELAAEKRVPVVTTLGGIATVPRDGPDSVLRRRFDSLATMNLRMLNKHHVAIAVGSDSYRTTSLPEALYLNSLGVLTNAELLRAWTETTARAIFTERRIGRLEPGYEASFLVLDANPLDDFANVKRIRLRFKQGSVIQVPPQ
ncbi:MAG: amidohydrolase family protein [Gemmatimonadaceae bacterium]